MKNLFLICITLISINSNAQNFTFNLNDGSTDFVVYQADKKTSSELYQKTLNWINETYKNPEKVIKAKVENEMIRIEGFGTSVFGRTFESGSKADYDVRYTLEFQFQDNKYRVKYSHQSISIDGNQVYFKLIDVLNNIPDTNGNAWVGAKEQYQTYVQKLLDSLNTYITKPKEKW